MYYKSYIKDTSRGGKKAKKEDNFIKKVYDYLQPILNSLEHQIDKRLTYTVFDTFMGMLSFRDRINGLLLSELGGYINGPKHAPAGTKRLSNLLRDKNWSHELLENALLDKAQNRLTSPERSPKQWLLHWDDSVIEKSESWQLEGLCPVFSSKASRLTRIKPGYYKKYGRVYVPGFEWSAGVLSSLSDRPTIGIMKWWTTKGKHRDSRNNILYKMLAQSTKMIKQTQTSVWHVFDRGYARKTILDYLINDFDQQFIIRWKSKHLLVNTKGESKNTYKHSLGKKSTSTRKVWDKERKEYKKVSILYMPVRDPEINEKQLYLVILRENKRGRKPIYFLTDIPIHTNAKAWIIMKSYMKRWDVEQVFRFGKSTMAMESPRLWFWENRLKLLMLVTLVMNFILTLMHREITFSWNLIKTWAPRTGNRQKNTFLPIYRLRLAISLFIIFDLVPT